MYGLPTEMVGALFMQCLLKGDIRGFFAFGSTNVHAYKSMHGVVKGHDIRELCPCDLRILDAKAQGFDLDDEPDIDKLAVIKYLKRLAPRVEGKAGLTLLTMPKNMTLNQEVAIAKKMKIRIDIWEDEILEVLGDVAAQSTYRILISNNVVKKTRKRDYDVQQQRVRRVGFDSMPTIAEYLLLCISTQKVFNCKCPYLGDTFASSSTSMNDCPLLIGGSKTSFLQVECDSDYTGFADEDCGAGGRVKFEGVSDHV